MQNDKYMECEFNISAEQFSIVGTKAAELIYAHHPLD